jgi:poly-gamma-glutamate synthesis protein (capsule biosynthesis protein)
MLSGEVGRRHPPGTGAATLFGDLMPLLRSGDIVFGNLETPLCDGRSTENLFRGDPRMAETLAQAGFNVLSLANNHVLDYGPEGLRQCAAALESVGIRALGAGDSREAARRPIVLDRRGLRVGLLGFGRTLQEQPDPGAPGFAEWDEERAVRSVRELAGSVDCVVVSIHIGLMWIDYPKPEYKEMTDRLMAAGAHVVLMHHAHVLQGYLASEGRLAVYNLGNCVADIEEGEVREVIVPERQKESALFVVDLDRRGVAEVAVVPTVITDDFTVRIADDDQAGLIVDRLERISEEVRSGRYRRAYALQRSDLTAGNTLAMLWGYLRMGRWGEFARAVLRARPEHLLMFGRFGVRRLGALWKRQ